MEIILAGLLAGLFWFAACLVPFLLLIGIYVRLGQIRNYLIDRGFVMARVVPVVQQATVQPAPDRAADVAAGIPSFRML